LESFVRQKTQVVAPELEIGGGHVDGGSGELARPTSVNELLANPEITRLGVKEVC